MQFIDPFFGFQASGSGKGLQSVRATSRLKFWPTGSMYPILEVSGSRHHTFNDNWGQHPGIWVDGGFWILD